MSPGIFRAARAAPTAAWRAYGAKAPAISFASSAIAWPWAATSASKSSALPATGTLMRLARWAGAASVPLALDTAVRDGRIQRGQSLMLEGVGGGFTWGAALVVY